MSIILGINAFHGDASAALLIDGKLACAIEEERLNRVKHCAGFPSMAVREVLRVADVRPDEIDHIAIGRDPGANLHKKALFASQRMNGGALAESARDRLGNAARVRAVDALVCQALGIPRDELNARVWNVEHHRAHLASALFASPFERAAVVTLDGFGDFVSTMWGVGAGNSFTVQGQVEFPHSLGILYTAVTQWLGFPKYGDEGKVMGLAPYGNPVHRDRFRELIRLQDDGTFELNLKYFRHASEGVEMTWDDGSPHVGLLYTQALVDLLGPPREPGGAYTTYVHDVASTLQATLEDAIFNLLRAHQARTGERNLCLAGGVALNSVANGKVRERTAFTDVFVQPAAGDNGTSLGAALWVWCVGLGRPRVWQMEHAYTGPAFSRREVRAVLEKSRDALKDITVAELSDDAFYDRVASHIEQGKVVGWFQGQMEFGPRALGNRSIVADPRRAEMKDILNSRIKHREAFRPFAPSVLAEKTGEWFVHDWPSPTMLMVYDVREDKRARIPAVTHVDGSGRLQTVEEKHNARYYRLIQAFERRTGVPVVLNTSFNENEPVVCTPQDALNCFLKTRMDVLVMDDFVLERRE
ncbi:MAG: carbamoyltransferase C-terminal domain-containing protein [Myxococcota bacterium]